MTHSTNATLNDIEAVDEVVLNTCLNFYDPSRDCDGVPLYDEDCLNEGSISPGRSEGIEDKENGNPEPEPDAEIPKESAENHDKNPAEGSNEGTSISESVSLQTETDKYADFVAIASVPQEPPAESVQQHSAEPVQEQPTDSIQEENTAPVNEPGTEDAGTQTQGNEESTEPVDPPGSGEGESGVPETDSGPEEESKKEDVVNEPGDSKDTDSDGGSAENPDKGEAETPGIGEDSGLKDGCGNSDSNNTAPVEDTGEKKEPAHGDKEEEQPVEETSGDGRQDESGTAPDVNEEDNSVDEPEAEPVPTPEPEAEHDRTNEGDQEPEESLEPVDGEAEDAEPINVEEIPVKAWLTPERLRVTG